MKELVCQVCGAPMRPGDEVVECERCSTPHHRDCWEYLGHCSTYSCATRASASSELVVAGDEPSAPLVIDDDGATGVAASSGTAAPAPPVVDRRRWSDPARCRALEPFERSVTDTLVAWLAACVVPTFMLFLLTPKLFEALIGYIVAGWVAALVLGSRTVGTSVLLDPRARSVQRLERRPWGTSRHELFPFHEVGTAVVQREVPTLPDGTPVDQGKNPPPFNVVLYRRNGECFAWLGMRSVTQANDAAEEFARLTSAGTRRLLEDRSHHEHAKRDKREKRKKRPGRRRRKN